MNFLYIYHVQCFEGRDKDGDKLLETTLVVVHASSEREAIKKAKSLAKKKYYRVAQIVEVERREDRGPELIKILRKAHAQAK